jgi:hypothetical protein
MMKKIFNQTSVFDKIFVVVVFLVLAFLAYAFFRKSTYITVTVKVGEENVTWARWSREWFSQYFYPGMKERDGLGRTTAEVLSVRSYDNAKKDETPMKAVFLTVKVKAVYSKSSDTYSYKGLPILVGATMKMYLDDVLTEGLVVGVQGLKDPRRQANITVEAILKDENQTYLGTSGEDTYVADAIKVGQKVFDDQGNVLIEILDKKVTNAKQTTTTNTGALVVTENPLKKDVVLKLKINAIELNGRYFLFDDRPILIGYDVPINTPDYSIFPLVSKIETP